MQNREVVDFHSALEGEASADTTPALPITRRLHNAKFRSRSLRRFRGRSKGGKQCAACNRDASVLSHEFHI